MKTEEYPYKDINLLASLHWAIYRYSAVFETRFETSHSESHLDSLTMDFYRPRMWEGNVFILSVCLSVCVSVQAITFACLDIETSFLVWWDILIISRSGLSTKVIG